jgi:hypothetical protein
MRNFVAVGLIVCGTILALAPAASDYLQSRQIGEYLAAPSQPGAAKFMRQPVPEAFMVAGWILGGAMISLGIFGGSRSASTNTHPRSDSSTLSRATI